MYVCVLYTYDIYISVFVVFCFVCLYMFVCMYVCICMHVYTSYSGQTIEVKAKKVKKKKRDVKL